jgi:hypothetical protein
MNDWVYSVKLKECPMMNSFSIDEKEKEALNTMVCTIGVGFFLRALFLRTDFTGVWLHALYPPYSATPGSRTALAVRCLRAQRLDRAPRY